MIDLAPRPIARPLCAAIAVAAVVAAFLRGDYLLGVECGAIYAAITLGLLWLLARSRTPAGGVSPKRAVLVALFALPVGYAMAYPASLSPDLRGFIDMQATDRRARAELAAVFASDPAYWGLSVSSDHRKVVVLTVQGSLGTRGDLDRLRLQMSAECPVLHQCECGLCWQVTLQDSGQRVDGLDRDVFPVAETGASPDRRGMSVPPVRSSPGPAGR